MTAYYPSQVGYSAMSRPYMIAQPGYGMPAPYIAGGVAAPQMISAAPTAVVAPVMMQPSHYGYGYYNPHTWCNRIRRFFGLGPDPGVRYKSSYSTWGFMGYSRRQRYIDVRTGGDVDREGHPVYIVE